MQWLSTLTTSPYEFYPAHLSYMIKQSFYLLNPSEHIAFYTLSWTVQRMKEVSKSPSELESKNTMA